MVSSSQLILLTCRSGEPVHGLVSMKEKITQKFNTYLAARVVAIAGPSLLTLIIIALWVAPVIASQNKKIASIEKKTCECDQLVEGNTTTQITELQSQLQTLKEEILQLTQQNLSQLERNLTRANKKISELETQVSDLNETVRENDETADGSLNQTHYDTLHQTIQQLDSSKASQTDLEALATEVEVLSNSTVRTTTFHQQVENIESTTLQLQYNINQLRLNITSIDGRVRQINVTLATKAELLDSVRSDIESLNATKASWQALEDSTARLYRDKVDRGEFEVLSANLTSLAEASSNEDDVIRQELSELADSSLNQTHYDTLHQTIQQLDSSKASQTDLEALATEVEVLSNSTVRTTTFHQQVESIESTTLQLQYSITSIDGRVRQINVTLATKANQVSLDRLQTSKVDTQTFQKLEGTVRNLNSSKANESDLSSLRITVKSLRDTAGSNTGRIEQLESSSSGLTASWVTVSMSVILVTLSLTILIYPL